MSGLRAFPQKFMTTPEEHEEFDIEDVDMGRFEPPDDADAVEAFNNLIDNVRSTHREYKTLEDRDNASFQHDARKHAKEYLNSPSMHTPALGSALLLDLLDAELAPLKRMAHDNHHPGRLTSFLPKPWNKIVPGALSFLFFAVCLLVALFLFVSDLPWLAWLVVGYLIWHYGRRFWGNYVLTKTRAELSALVHNLTLIRDEVKSGFFDAEELNGRLHRYEEREGPLGHQINTLVYAMLRSLGPPKQRS